MLNCDEYEWEARTNKQQTHNWKSTRKGSTHTHIHQMWSWLSHCKISKLFFLHFPMHEQNFNCEFWFDGECRKRKQEEHWKSARNQSYQRTESLSMQEGWPKKSTTISLVLVAFISKYELSHQSTKLKRVHSSAQIPEPGIVSRALSSTVTLVSLRGQRRWTDGEQTTGWWRH